MKTASLNEQPYKKSIPKTIKMFSGSFFGYYKSEVILSIFSFKPSHQIHIIMSELSAPTAAKTGIIGRQTFTWNHF